MQREVIMRLALLPAHGWSRIELQMAWQVAIGPPVGLRLIGTTMLRSGVALLTYRPEVA